MLIKGMLVLAMALSAAGGLVRWALPQEDPARWLAHAGFSLQESIVKAAKEAKEGAVVRAVLEEDDGRIIYSVEFVQGSKILEVDLDAKTGELVKKDLEDEDKSAALKACTFPLAKALETALQKVPGKAIEVEAELTPEGKGRYDVKIFHEGKVRKVVLDGASGEVLSVKTKKEGKEN